MSSIAIGNIISLFAAIFTLASAWSTEKKRIYLYQTVQCLIMAVANIFFASVSGVTTFVLCAVRNLLVAYGRFNKRLCIVFVAAVAVLGITANNRGAIGLIPVATTVLYTVLCFYAQRPKAIKLNIFANLSLWALYDILILDYVSFAVDTGSALAALLSLFRKGANEPVQE